MAIGFENMPNKHAAEKAMRQVKKALLKNRTMEDQIKKVVKIGGRAVKAGKLDEAKKIVSNLAQKVDKAVKQHIIKANRANRIKSRFAALLRKASVKR